MGRLKEKYMEMYDHAWDLIVAAELGEGMTMERARSLFKLEYPDNLCVFDQAVEEYEAENDTPYDYQCPGYDTTKEKEMDLGDKFERLSTNED